MTRDIMAEARAVKEWNARYLPGARVWYTPEIGEPVETRTRGRAEMLAQSGGVIQLEGVAGRVPLWSVEPIPSDRDLESQGQGSLLPDPAA